MTEAAPTLDEVHRATERAHGLLHWAEAHRDEAVREEADESLPGWIRSSAPIRFAAAHDAAREIAGAMVDMPVREGLKTIERAARDLALVVLAEVWAARLVEAFRARRKPDDHLVWAAWAYARIIAPRDVRPPREATTEPRELLRQHQRSYSVDPLRAHVANALRARAKWYAEMTVGTDDPELAAARLAADRTSNAETERVAIAHADAIHARRRDSFIAGMRTAALAKSAPKERNVTSAHRVAAAILGAPAQSKWTASAVAKANRAVAHRLEKGRAAFDARRMGSKAPFPDDRAALIVTARAQRERVMVKMLDTLRKEPAQPRDPQLAAILDSQCPACGADIRKPEPGEVNAPDAQPAAAPTRSRRSRALRGSASAPSR